MLQVACRSRTFIMTPCTAERAVWHIFKGRKLLSHFRQGHTFLISYKTLHQSQINNWCQKTQFKALLEAASLAVELNNLEHITMSTSDVYLLCQ